MRLWLIGLVGLALHATPLGAADRFGLRIVTNVPREKSDRSLRIGEDPRLPPMLPHLGLVAETEVVANTRIGVGFVPMSIRNPATEWQKGSRAPNNRKPGISVRLRF